MVRVNQRHEPDVSQQFYILNNFSEFCDEQRRNTYEATVLAYTSYLLRTRKNAHSTARNRIEALKRHGHAIFTDTPILDSRDRLLLQAMPGWLEVQHSALGGPRRVPWVLGFF